jgi:hypothetical protein
LRAFCIVEKQRGVLSSSVVASEFNEHEILLQVLEHVPNFIRGPEKGTENGTLVSSRQLEIFKTSYGSARVPFAAIGRPNRRVLSSMISMNERTIMARVILSCKN